ncbi:MAG: hypothetical protein GF383_05085 [Candidatus Lokiarchaeota archaeon]|nr:hypothetical protein [Candidatus Lokiarchaeota archaeon]MBD3339264.1 hypothetical protein [Candidatus Lokiarchaeota archaeon]
MKKSISSDMSLFSVSIYQDYKDNLLNHLSRINTVHIKTKSKEKSEIKEKSEEESTLIKKIKKLRENNEALFKKLNLSESIFKELKIKKKERFEAKDLQELINRTLEEINFYANRINELERYISRATLELENIKLINDCYRFLEKYNLNRFILTYFKELRFRVYTTFSKNLPNLENLLDISAFPNVHQVENISEDRVVFFIIYPKVKEDDLQERIKLIHAEEVQILKKYLTYDKINFERINKEIGFLENTLSKYHKEISRIRQENLLKFAAINEVIENIEDWFFAERQFEEIGSNRLKIKFYVPSNRKDTVRNGLIKEFRDKITIDILDISKKTAISEQESLPEKAKERAGVSEEKNDLREDTPTVMKNPFFIRPFETITRLYGTPSYSEIDPTPFLAITFPLIFGLMFGDIGHGICLIIAGLIGAFIFRKRKGSIYNMSWIIFYCGWGAVIGGFLYGEFFGTEELNLIFYSVELNPVRIFEITLHNPLENIITVFYFAILVGVFHICLGWFIQFLNYWRQKRKYLALSDSLLKILLLVGGTVLIFVFGLNFESWFTFPYPILFPLVPGLLLLITKPLGKLLNISYLDEESYGDLIGEGSIETFETALSVMSNVASYVRVLALALAHIALMISIQAMIGLIRGEGILFQILIVIGLIFGNMIVILLEGLLVFLNTIRLHFYEFFFKFYQGSGTEFFPFYLDNNYSEIIFRADIEKDIISEEIEKEISIKLAKENIDRAVSYISDKYL